MRFTCLPGCRPQFVIDCFTSKYWQTSVRNYATKKRFYKNTSVISDAGKFEVTLDHRKLKTPTGKPFVLQNEDLALAIACEWNYQKNIIQQSTMHLTSLCNTVIDNPNNLTKYDVVNYLVNYIGTDTILCQHNEDNELYQEQQKRWDPVIQWFCDRYKIDVRKKRDFLSDPIDPAALGILTRHFMSYNYGALTGLVFGVDSMKSVILMMACVEGDKSPEEVTDLSRLEESFQSKFWGEVEWSHTLSKEDIKSRLTAALLIVHSYSFSETLKSKQL